MAACSRVPDRPAMLTTLLALLPLHAPAPIPTMGDGDLPKKSAAALEETRQRALALRTELPSGHSGADQVRAMVRRAAAAAVALPKASTIADELREAGREALRTAAAQPRAAALLMEMVTRSAALDLAFEPIMEAPLPVGFPYPAPAGEIRVVEYPQYRMARAGMGMGRSNGAFFTLFRHISDRDIAMTAPVEMTMDMEKGRAIDMGFMYRTPDMGAAGEAGRVMVEDIQPMTVVTIGVRGRVEGAATDEALSELEAWLAARPDWEAAGNPRLMGYNGPSVPRRRQFSEVQIPVRRVAR